MCMLSCRHILVLTHIFMHWSVISSNSTNRHVIIPCFVVVFINVYSSSLTPQIVWHEALRAGATVDEIYDITKVKHYFVEQMKELVEEELNFIRIRTKLNEIMIAPEDDFIFIVVQNPSANS